MLQVRAEVRRVDGAADAIAPLEDERPEPALREVGRGDQGVVPAADHDGIPRRGRTRPGRADLPVPLAAITPPAFRGRAIEGPPWPRSARWHP